MHRQFHSRRRHLLLPLSCESVVFLLFSCGFITFQLSAQKEINNLYFFLVNFFHYPVHGAVAGEQAVLQESQLDRARLVGEVYWDRLGSIFSAACVLRALLLPLF